MIFWELLKVFALSLIGINGIMLMGGIVAEASRNGLGFLQVLGAIPLLIPSLLPYTVPATTLFATCVVYGRLSHDNEILAIRAAGINLGLVMRPAITLGLATSLITFVLYHSLIPYTHLLLRSMVLKDVEGLIYSYLKKDGALKQPHLNYAIFVRKVEGRKLIDAIFKIRNAHGEPEKVIRAKEAELQVDMAHRTIRVNLRNGEIWDNAGTFVFREEIYEEPLPNTLGGNYEARPSDLMWHQILDEQVETRKMIDDIKLELEAASANRLPKHSTEKLPEHMRNLRFKLDFYQSKLYQLNAELQLRPALAMGCLFFVLVGAPVGVWFSRSDYLSAFMSCFLPIVFLYYPLFLCGANFAKDGKFIPELCIWAADAAVGLLGLLFYWRMVRN